MYFCTVVYHQCQCSLFKQFTTINTLEAGRIELFIINVNVLFLSNSQLRRVSGPQYIVVYHQCQCSLFKQFTTPVNYKLRIRWLFIINVNVLFLSNSQLTGYSSVFWLVVYHQCQCSLFKQFTTVGHNYVHKKRCLSSMSMFSF